ncbi:MAG: hypothetical protein ABWZ75_10950 [Novosphingobium sp.]
MDAKAVAKAKTRLRVARKALDELPGCADYDDFNDTWYTFLVAAKNVYTVLEQGAKTSSQSLQWFGGVKRFRKDDELLQYLFEARNDDEHGLGSSTEHVPGALAIGVARDGYSRAMRINGSTGPGGVLNVESLDGKPVLIERTLPHIRLIGVQARGNRTIAPPTMHRGSKLTDASPLNVATLGLAYLAELVVQAEARG